MNVSHLSTMNGEEETLYKNEWEWHSFNMWSLCKYEEILSLPCVHMYE